MFPRKTLLIGLFFLIIPFQGNTQAIPQYITFPIKPTEEILIGTSTYSSGTIFKTNLVANGTKAETIRSYSPKGSKPSETLIDGGDGYIYGATTNGGINAAGLIFRMAPDGTSFQIIHHFQETDGTFPSGGLLKGADGKLYGATELGGQYKHGVIYRLDPDGSNFQSLHHFTQFEGSYLNGDLIQDANGTLFGMSTSGGGANVGSIFRLQPDGSGFQVIHSFNGTNGSGPYGGLLEGNDGKLYGMTFSGGSQQVGTIFRINKDGSGFVVIRNFDMVDGRNPIGKLAQDSGGTLFGFASSGGSFDNGVIFKLNPDGTGYQIIHSFIMPYGSYPRGSPVLVQNAIYGATIGGLDPHSVIFKINTDGTGFEILHGVTAGWEKPYPMGTLLIRTDGAMFGTVTGLDVSTDGAIFRFRPDTGEYTEIHSFEDNDGNFPSQLLLGKNHQLYGVTTYGGTHDGGILYSIDTEGSDHKVLHHFEAADGIQPFNTLTQAPDGTLFGSTSGGGVNVNAGTLFSIQPSGANFQVLHDFESTDGRDVRGALVRDNDGFLFGVTMEGGPGGGGVVFRIHESGVDFEVLHHFIGTTGIEGSNPVGGLTLGSDGVLYGTTYNGGAHGYGTIFRINRDGTSFTKLHDFNTNTGLNPSSQLIEGSQGNLIGLTSQGTAFYNTLFSINKDGTNFTVLRVFSHASGNWLYAGLIPGLQGYLYGTMSTVTGWAIYRIKEDGTGFLRIHELTEPQGFAKLTLVPKPSPENEVLFNNLSGKKVGDPPFGLVASSSSGLPITFSSSDPAVATVSGNIVTITGSGTTLITAFQPGDSQFAAAQPVSRSLTVTKTDQTLAFSAMEDKVFGDPPFGLVASSSSGLPITFSSSNLAVATVSGNIVTITGSGTTLITASQPGDNQFAAAQPVSRSLTVAKVGQVLTFQPIGTRSFGESPFQLVASSTSGLTVAFQSLSASVSITNNNATLVTPGKGRIKAIQSGSTNYHPAEAQQEFCINPPKPTITQSGNTLTSSAPLGNLWFHDGSPLGITGASFVPGSSGAYSVKVNIEGCESEPSNEFILAVTGDISNTAVDPITVAPNPASNKILIRLNNPNPSNPIQITIVNAAAVTMNTFTTSESELMVDVSPYPEGMYLVYTSLPLISVAKFLVQK